MKIAKELVRYLSWYLVVSWLVTGGAVHWGDDWSGVERWFATFALMAVYWFLMDSMSVYYRKPRTWDKVTGFGGYSVLVLSAAVSIGDRGGLGWWVLIPLALILAAGPFVLSRNTSE